MVHDEATHVIIAEGVEMIWSEAFKDKKKLTTIVSWPDSLLEIGRDAFRDCIGLLAIPNFPPKVKFSEEGYCFYRCQSVVTLPPYPNNIKIIPRAIFAYMDALVNLPPWPDSLEEIEIYGFSDVKSIVTIPPWGKNMKTLGEQAFARAKSLESCPDFLEGWEEIGVAAFCGCPKVTKLARWPKGCRIGRSNFNNDMWTLDPPGYFAKEHNQMMGPTISVQGGFYGQTTFAELVDFVAPEPVPVVIPLPPMVMKKDKDGYDIPFLAREIREDREMRDQIDRKQRNDERMAKVAKDKKEDLERKAVNKEKADAVYAAWEANQNK